MHEGGLQTSLLNDYAVRNAHDNNRRKFVRRSCPFDSISSGTPAKVGPQLYVRCEANVVPS